MVTMVKRSSSRLIGPTRGLSWILFSLLLLALVGASEAGQIRSLIREPSSSSNAFSSFFLFHSNRISTRFWVFPRKQLLKISRKVSFLRAHFRLSVSLTLSASFSRLPLIRSLFLLILLLTLSASYFLGSDLFKHTEGKRYAFLRRFIRGSSV
jgi:hypothetical protein